MLRGVLTIRILYVYFVNMYFKISMRKNPETKKLSGYYRLVESYRNHHGNVCVRTLLSAGFLDDLNPDQLNLIQKILTAKVSNAGNVLFDLPVSDDLVVLDYVELFYNRMVTEKRIDVPEKESVSKLRFSAKDYQRIDLNSIRSKDVREIGSEWLCFQALNQLRISAFLEQQGWKESDIRLALTHIISRAVFPASELKTSLWIKENSAVCEVTSFEKEKITKDRLYKISAKLYAEKEALEQFLSIQTNELFDIEDRIMLYDLTNTYFEGRKTGSELAKFGRSKEKRTDAKLVVLALVINPEGFIKYSAILEGNMSDPKSLALMIEKLRVKTSGSTKKALIVMDAGIATEDNLKMVAGKGFDYLCVTRSSMKNYIIEASASTVTITDNKKQKIELCPVKSDRNTDYYIKVESHTKELKERSMNDQFLQRFEEGMQKIAESLTKKGGVKQADKVHQRIGKLKQKYPSIARYFDIEVTVQELAQDKEKGKKKETQTDKLRIATAISWAVKQDVDINARSGVYFLRTSLTDNTQENLWQFYNTIREIEATFRILKTDLDLRPIYHKKDESSMAHLHLGLLAYWVVNTIRYQLKKEKIHSGWKEIVRIMNTQKAVTTTAQNDKDELIIIRRCSDPSEKVQILYNALKYKYVPYNKKKSVVLKSEYLE